MKNAVKIEFAIAVTEVTTVTVTSPQQPRRRGVKTSLGIGVGSTVADVKKAYPNAKLFNCGYAVELN